jgi:hypothetical protein
VLGWVGAGLACDGLGMSFVRHGLGWAVLNMGRSGLGWDCADYRLCCAVLASAWACLAIVWTWDGLYTVWPAHALPGPGLGMVSTLVWLAMGWS